ncbi:hypothetical protein N7414_30185 [Pseudomonas sp. GD04087]|uniref:hypothetical protein n=1 Tax=Pseudomonas TaxID=286 RepID=UPI001F2E621C|nr:MULTISPECIES: hypothetical protein [Pseudomonas]MDH0293409.1 hypothetical protein [Pseudomonas sp. GD04087]MDH1052994.1 hypothetical protein [Pseudomonas sp. GD03903]MDH2003137.1 hypothetical protein [Pseudomonas sp. GD03691]
MKAIPKYSALLLGLAASTSALAHAPFCECTALDAETIRCVGGFTDGSAAPGVTLDVLSATNHKVLLPGKLGADSSLTFKRPGEDFYILFDVGPGYMVEVDPSEIKGI